MKRKPDGTFYGHGHVRKFRGAIIFGADEVNVLLPETCIDKVRQYLDYYRKEWAGQKKGNVDEKEADPIYFTL
jgi:hypothetical protein